MNKLYDKLSQIFPPKTIDPALKRKTLIFNPKLCSGCGLCQSVCGSQEGQPDPSQARIQIINKAGTNFAIFCQHCLKPLCLPVCPQGAISQNDSGIVQVNQDLCINCGLCIQACPQAAPRLSAQGKLLKCDLCASRSNPAQPLCAEVCPQKAISFTQGKQYSWIYPLRWLTQLLSFFLLVIVLIGGVCSLNIATLDLACPFGVLQNVFSSKTIVLTTLVSGLFLITLSFILGRAFCGWLCPFGFILDLVDKIIPKRFTHFMPRFMRNRANKYGLALGGLAASTAVGTQAFCIVCPIGTVCRSYGLQSVMGSAELAIIPAVAALNLTDKRSWCRYLCPVGATLALFAKFGLLRIEIGTSKCKKFSCMRCADICPMAVIPATELVQGHGLRVNMAECISCLRCVDTCPHKAAQIKFIWQKS